MHKEEASPVKKLQQSRDEKVDGVSILVHQERQPPKEMDNSPDGMQHSLPGCWRGRRGICSIKWCTC